jgi:superfamily II DNA/RNA helicase
MRCRTSAERAHNIVLTFSCVLVTCVHSRTGISAAVVHGGTELAVRQQIFADFKSGKLNAITNCNVLTEVSLIVYA